MYTYIQEYESILKQLWKGVLIMSNPLSPDGRSYCANSDLFFYGATLGVRHFSEEAWRSRAKALKEVSAEISAELHK